LPALRRSPRRPRGPITLPKTNAYIFTKGLFQRTLLDTTPRSVQYICTQLGCMYSKKVETIQVVSTGNLIKHYNNRHKDIPTSVAEEKQKKAEIKEKPEFFRVYSSGSIDERFRKLIIHVIVSNNLPLSLVESQSFRLLISTLNA
jgi:isocitrate dehydrogenase